MLFLEKIKKEINHAQAVSFDIFDTLLVRPYLRPVDLFCHIERIKKIPGFFDIRQKTEREVRQDNPHKEDITFDEIYNDIDDVFKPLKSFELDFEKTVLRSNPEMKQVYDYAREKGKKIIIASDMYLPIDFVSEVLRQNGYDGWDKIYISGEIGQTKTTSNMFHLITKDFPNIPKNKILHIGDNSHSDYKMPLKSGISAILYPQVNQQFFKEFPALKRLAKSTKGSLGISILLASLAYRWQMNRCFGIKEDDYWHKIGYSYAGPLAYGYSRFVLKSAEDNGLNFLCFVARDGYTLQKVFNTFGSRMNSVYVYAPRFLNLICRLDYSNRNLLHTSAIISHFSQENERIKHLFASNNYTTARAQHKFIQKNKALFAKEAGKKLDDYKKYVLTVVPEKNKIGIVDTITGEFSSQELLQTALGQPLHGIYWSVLYDAYRGVYQRSCFLPSSQGQVNRDVYTLNWNFVEFLLSSPEYPIKGVCSDGSPLYESMPNATEKYRSDIYPIISGAAVEFAMDMKDRFKEYDIYLEGQDIVSYLNTFIENPTQKDMRKMVKLGFATDSAHSDYVPLFVSNIRLIDVFKHPSKSIKVLQKSVWRTPLQAFLLCLSKPVSIRIKGIKRISFILFPYLKKQYFKTCLQFNSHCYYKFIIGHKEN